MKDSLKGYKMAGVVSELLKNDKNFSAGGDGAVAPGLRLFSVLMTIILTALTKNAAFTEIVFSVLFVRLALMKPLSIWNILKRTIPACLFTAVFTFPAIFMGSPKSFITVTSKVLVSILIIAELNETMSWKKTLHVMSDIKIPSVIILTIDMTVHFLVILGRVSTELLEAVRLRSIGRSKWKNAPTGGVMGTTYLISERMANETAEAMTARGFAGKYNFTEKHKLGKYDLLMIFLCVINFIVYIYLNKVK